VYLSILVEEYRKLPKLRRGADLEMWQQRLRLAIRDFCNRIQERYTEGTLQRLLSSPFVKARRAAVLALGTLGTWSSNHLLARMLHDPDERTANMAADALWELWGRGGTPTQNQCLREIAHLTDPAAAMRDLNRLIQTAPQFAEAWNQRAVLFFQRGEFRRSIEDCERVLELNPHHFGAQCGIGHCYSKLHMIRAAVGSYRRALEINPRLTHLEEVIRGLEETIGETGDELG
jgi:tetratricopeptide (TPR) repeat protein